MENKNTENNIDDESEQSIREEELQKIAGAIEGNIEAIFWCQKHFIDVLPWNKKDDWSDTNIEDIHGYPKCKWIFLKLGIKNVQECKTGFFEKISSFMEPEYGHTRLTRLGLRTLREYMEKQE